MVDAMLLECRRARVILHAYVVMPNHIHMLLRLPEGLTSSAFMRSFKPRTSLAIRKRLLPEEIAEFSNQTGLNRNTFWQRSFRGILIEDQRNFEIKLRYIHNNPIRSGYVSDPVDYQWSSAKAWTAGQWSEERGLAVTA
jgi:putative transposase